MSKMQTQRRNQAKLARLEIVSQMFLRQYTVRQIRAEVMKRLNLSTYSTATVQNDIKTVLEELQQQRLDNAEYALQLSLSASTRRAVSYGRNGRNPKRTMSAP